MIKTFADKETVVCYAGLRVRRFAAYWLPVARRKLDQLQAAETLEFLRVPPGNRLEALRGRPCGAMEHPHQRPVAAVF